MANSSIVRKAKNRIVKEFIKDPEIVAAINSDKINRVLFSKDYGVLNYANF